MRRFRQYSDDVHGIEVEPERVAEASRDLPNIVLAVGEALPYPDDHFDLVFSNEVIEHVDDDRATAAEMVRVTKPGGAIVAFAPNRLYPFETHGAYVGGRYVFGNIPLVNWLPDPLRDRFAPHVRAYTQRGLRRLFAGQPVRLVHHRVIYPGFDNITARHAAPGDACSVAASTSPSTRRCTPSASRTSWSCGRWASRQAGLTGRSDGRTYPDPQASGETPGEARLSGVADVAGSRAWTSSTMGADQLPATSRHCTWMERGPAPGSRPSPRRRAGTSMRSAAG